MSGRRRRERHGCVTQRDGRRRRGPRSEPRGPGPAGAGGARPAPPGQEPGDRRCGSQHSARPTGRRRTPTPSRSHARSCSTSSSVQARSRHELEERLARRDVPEEVASRLLDRFEEVGLVDDEAFARAWVDSRQRTRGLGRTALAVELRRKGIADETARTVLAEVDPGDEEAAARARGAAQAAQHARSRRPGRRTAAGRDAGPQGLLRPGWPTPSSGRSWHWHEDERLLTAGHRWRTMCP